MKKILLGSMAVLSIGVLSACSNNSSGSTSTLASSSSKKVERHYKYHSEGQSFYSDKGSMKINKLIGYKKDNNKYFILDVTFKNTSKKQQTATDIMSPNIEAYQLNEDKSQKVHLVGSNSASDYYSTDNIDNYNRFNEITDSHSNKILPGKTMRTLMEFSYKLNNEKNNITFSLSDSGAVSGDTVNPKKNKIVIKPSDIKFNSLNLNNYSD